MRAVILGGNGQIGSLIGDALEHGGHDVIRASRRSGVDAVTGEGLVAVLKGADVVIDALHIDTIRKSKAVKFFETTSRNIVKAVAEVGVPHLVTVSIYNAAMPEAQGYGYFAGKAAQERIVKESGLPSTIVLSTQWYELADTILSKSQLGPIAIAPHYVGRPASAQAVAEEIAVVAVGSPQSAGVIIAGPENRDLHDFVVEILKARGSTAKVLGINPPGMGLFKSDFMVPPADIPGVGPTFEEWLATY
ncbi:MAG: NAD(P)H-binding protein [Candidatus Nanopelagicales bacterium]